jgi:DNA recombination protein RmuC
MTADTVIIIVLLVAVFGLSVFQLLWKTDKEDSQSMGLLQSQMVGLSQATTDLTTNLQALLSDQSKQVALGLQEVKHSTTQVLSLGPQLQNFEKILTHSKHRGIYGENSLKLILGNTLQPADYEMEYEFADKTRVDSIVKTKEGLIPIDGKFPLDNYRLMIEETDEGKRADFEKAFKRDVKTQIDQTAKYIRPGERTLPFAIMFVPAEGVFHDLIANSALIEYAHKQDVHIASPMLLAALLNTIVFGFRAFKIEEDTKLIQKNVESLTKHLKAYEECFRKVGVSIGAAASNWNDARTAWRGINKDVLPITGTSPDLNVPSLDRPQAAQ